MNAAMVRHASLYREPHERNLATRPAEPKARESARRQQWTPWKRELALREGEKRRAEVWREEEKRRAEVRREDEKRRAEVRREEEKRWAEVRREEEKRWAKVRREEEKRRAEAWKFH